MVWGKIMKTPSSSCLILVLIVAAGMTVTGADTPLPFVSPMFGGLHGSATRQTQRCLGLVQTR